MVDVVLPSHGYLHQLPESHWQQRYQFEFAGKPHNVGLFLLQQKTSGDNISMWVIDHEGLAPCGVGNVYCSDADNRPFATDASKYALFAMAVATAIEKSYLPRPSVLHLHDWHSAFILMLRQFMPMPILQAVPTVYSIHNLAIQGIRPFQGDESSLENWFPELDYQPLDIADPVYVDCVNPMRAGINLADKVHTVSPSYASEIQLPSQVDKGFYGGERLERDLQNVAKQGKLFGILNGCEYADKSVSDRRIDIDALMVLFKQTVLHWTADSEYVYSAHNIAMTRLSEWQTKSKQGCLVTSIGRLTQQKASLFQQEVAPGLSCLDAMLQELAEADVFVMLGSGDKQIEQFMTQVSARHSQFFFLKGYSDMVANALYENGDLFVMPSSFEPCGISQMLAMRAGQPCLVHGVGGLKDTVQHLKNGFVFNGDDPQQQSKDCLKKFQLALNKKNQKPEQFNKIALAAKNARFSWESSAKEYLEFLYS